MNAGCPAIFARIETWLFIALAGVCSIALLYVATRASPRSIVLAQAASGIIVGLFFQPSTSGILALLVAVFSLVALPRGRLLYGGLALFAFGVAAGMGALIITSTTPARC